MEREIFVVGLARTAIGTFGGSLKDVPNTQLATTVIKAAIERSGVAADMIGHVVMGNVIPTEVRDAYLSRVAAIDAGCPIETPAFNVNRLCGSGLQAIVSAAQALAVGDCEHKHGKEFKKIALSLGMIGPMRSAGAGPALKAKLAELSAQLGPYPHGGLHISTRLSKRSPRPRAKCKACGFEVPMYKKFLAFGPPLCPKHKTEMEPLGDWE